MIVLSFPEAQRVCQAAHGRTLTLPHNVGWGCPVHSHLPWVPQISDYLAYVQAQVMRAAWTRMLDGTSAGREVYVRALEGGRKLWINAEWLRDVQAEYHDALDDGEVPHGRTETILHTGRTSPPIEKAARLLYVECELWNRGIHGWSFQVVFTEPWVRHGGPDRVRRNTVYHARYVRCCVYQSIYVAASLQTGRKLTIQPWSYYAEPWRARHVRRFWEYLGLPCDYVSRGSVTE